MPHVIGEVDVEERAVETHMEGWEEAFERAFEEARRVNFGLGQTVNVKLSAILKNPSQVQKYMVTLS